MATSADFTIQEVKGIKQSFDNGSRFAFEQLMTIPAFDIQSTDEWAEIFTSTEGLGGADELAEQETPAVNALDDGYSVTITTKRWGNAIEVTETAQQKMEDNTLKVRTFLERERDRLLRSVKYKFVTELHKFFNYAFATTYFAAPDTVALCGSHSWNTSGSSSWDNSATASLDTTAMDTAMEYGGAVVDGNGEETPVSYNVIIVKKASAASRMARKLFAEGIKPVAIGDINLYEGELLIVETPYISSTNKKYWFLLDTNIAVSPLYAGIKQFPTMQEPIKQNNEAVRANCTAFWKQGINDMPYNFYGSTGAT